MNIKSIATALIIASIGFTSCKKDLEPQESSPEAATPATEVQSNANTQQPSQQMPQQMPQPMPQTAVSQTP
ncbi:MAG TPA: hypothetical protein VGB43_01655, partial [Flavobacterium sp.]